MPQVSKSENLREVGNKIRYYREKKKMSQLELAEAIGVTQNTIYLIETARSEMKLGKLFSIAEVILIGVILSIFLSIPKKVKKCTENEWKERYTTR